MTNTESTAPFTANMTVAERRESLLWNRTRSRQRICPVKSAAAAMVSHSPRPSRISPGFTPLSIAQPAMTSAHAVMTSGDGIRRERSATVSGTKTHVNCVKNAEVLAAM